MTAVLVHIFTTSETDFPYASYWVSKVKALPGIQEELALPTDDNDWRPIVGRVTFVRWQSGLRTREVGVQVDVADEDLRSLAQRLQWMRHRQAG